MSTGTAGGSACPGGPRPLAHRHRPCSECPWRVDVASGRFGPERFAALEETHGRPGAEAPLDAPLFACHKSREGADLACAGFLAVEGRHHLGVRLAVIQRRLPVAALQPGSDWPELYRDYESMSTANGRPLSGAVEC